MSWVLPLQAIEDRVEDLRTGEQDLPLYWGPSLHADRRPTSLHIVWNVITFDTQPLEIGWAEEDAGGSPPDETTGEIQFDYYARASDGSGTVRTYSQTIRAHFRGVTASGVRYGVPSPANYLGTESAGWVRYVQRVPFTIEDA